MTVIIPNLSFISTNTKYLQDLAQLLYDLEWCRASWLEGSFGKGNADCYSDIDLHLLISPSASIEDVGEALHQVEPLVIFKVMFNQKMLYSMTESGLRADLWVHDTPPPLLNADEVKILFDKEGSLPSPTVEQPVEWNLSERQELLGEKIQEFWRCIALAPIVLGRKEFVVAYQGLFIESSLLIEISLIGRGVKKNTGVKKLNQFLPEKERQELENALILPSFDGTSLLNAHLALSKLGRKWGTKYAQLTGIPYNSRLEECALKLAQST